jgi:hypothetical protein
MLAGAPAEDQGELEFLGGLSQNPLSRVVIWAAWEGTRPVQGLGGNELTESRMADARRLLLQALPLVDTRLPVSLSFNLRMFR